MMTWRRSEKEKAVHGSIVPSGTPMQLERCGVKWTYKWKWNRDFFDEI